MSGRLSTHDKTRMALIAVAVLGTLYCVGTSFGCGEEPGADEEKCIAECDSKHVSCVRCCNLISKSSIRDVCLIGCEIDGYNFCVDECENNGKNTWGGKAVGVSKCVNAEGANCCSLSY